MELDEAVAELDGGIDLDGSVVELDVDDDGEDEDEDKGEDKGEGANGEFAGLGVTLGRLSALGDEGRGRPR